MEQLFLKPPIILKPNIYKNICLLALLLFMGFVCDAQEVLMNDSICIITNKLNPNQTLQRISPGELHFTKIKNRRINFGLTGPEYHYIILKLNGEKTLYNQYLSIDNTSIDTVSIYRLHENGNDSLIYRGGQLIPFDRTRNFVWHTAPIEISNIPSYYCIAVKSAQKNINFNYQISGRNELFQNYERYERIVFFYIGIAFMISAIILLAFFLFRRIVFAAYLAYMIFISVWILSHYGKIYPYFHPQVPVLNNIIQPMASLAAGLFLLIVLQAVFVQNLQNKIFLTNLIKWSKGILLVTTVSMLLLLNPETGNSFRKILFTVWHIELLFLIALIIFIPFHFFKENFIARIFSLAMFVICMMTLIQLFANRGFVQSYFLNEHGMALAILLENSIMAFGLFYGLMEERKNKELQLLALEAEQTSTLKKLINLQDQERKRIAGDLHDNIGPLLAALKINFRRIVNVKEEKKQLELVEKTENIIDDSIVEIRNIAHNLMPKSLSSKGLINTLYGYFEDMEQLYRKKIYFNHDVESIFDPELQMNIYRITSELVMNAAKHSEAEIISVCIHSHKGMLSIFIRDNGQGFDLKHNGNKNSLGIQSAESRVNYLKGKIKLKSDPGKGSTVDIEIPL